MNRDSAFEEVAPGVFVYRHSWADGTCALVLADPDHANGHSGHRRRRCLRLPRSPCLAGAPQKGGLGTWMLHGIHSIAQLRYGLGEVAVVYARQHRAASFQRADVEATVSATLTLVPGGTVQLLQTAETRLPEPLAGYVLHGDQGSLQAHAASCRVFSEGQDAATLPIPPLRHGEYALELAAFVDAVAGIEGPTAGIAARRSLAIMQAGYESMVSGAPVHLAQRFGPL